MEDQAGSLAKRAREHAPRAVVPLFGLAGNLGGDETCHGVSISEGREGNNARS
jgi:hypothetical protein